MGNTVEMAGGDMNIVLCRIKFDRKQLLLLHLDLLRVINF